MEFRMKTCNKCGGDGPFSVDRGAKDGLRRQCKNCDRKYRDGHKEEIAKYYEDHRKERCEYGRVYYQENRKERCEYYRKRYQENKEKITRYVRRYNQTDKGKESERRSNKKTRDKYPEKTKANRKLRSAIRSGKITKPGTCSMSDEHCSGRIHGHHEDYSKPLDVTWLCSYHHARLHRIKREKNRVAGPLLESYYFEQWPTHLDL